MKRLLNWIECVFGHHDWTCNAQEGMPPKPSQLAAGVIGFRDYAIMYCKRCGAVFHPER